VQSQVLPQLARVEEDGIWSYESILGQLERALYNPHRYQEAEDRLHELVQGSNTVVAYVSKFERLLYEVKGHN
jgi:Retrotransposon gag protein